ncbi:MAG: hypothetical protein ACRDHF_00840 [Tepidiformaceae bacterium]
MRALLSFASGLRGDVRGATWWLRALLILRAALTAFAATIQAVGVITLATFPIE